ncbi:MAG: MATE family efflux transporter [Lachnospiraceae bacterium]|nr:MATE family efflux transporter [Lachnospiraceae bacterium]
MNSPNRTNDLTQGHPLKQIILFSLPLVFGTLFQQVYSFADTVIVGRCLGVDALAAVGNTYSLNFLTLGFLQGACVGFSILVAQSFGAKNPEEMRRYLWNGTWLSAAVSLLMTISMLLVSGPLLRMIHTPEAIFDLSLVYINVIFIGIPATALYNYSANVLRALGDSRRPFYFLLFSSLLNIALDYLFILPLQMGILGAALATVLSQLVSGLLNIWWLFTRVDIIRIHREEMTVSGRHLKRLCLIGLPMGFEYSVSAVGAVVMQNSINSLGSIAVAAQTAGEKIRQMFTLPMESVGMAMATYAGQNYGAGRMDRVKSGIRYGLLIQTVYSACAWLVLFLSKYALVRFVLGPSETEVFDGGVQYLTLISTLFVIHGSLMIFRNTLQGLGYSLHAILSGVGELIGRSLGGWLAVYAFGYPAICYANPLAWFLALCYCVVMTAYVLQKKQKVS